MTQHVHARCPRPPAATSGFTLTELAVVVAIVALAVGGMLIPLAAQDNLRREAETRKSLEGIQEALLGFAVAHGRLPCPATAASGGFESFCQETSGQPYLTCTPVSPAGPAAFPPATPYRCTNPYDGFVPAATLGIGPVDGQGRAIDGWNNPIRYAVATQSNLTAGNAWDFTTPDGLRNRGLSKMFDPGDPNYPNYIPDLWVCSGGGITFAGTASGPKTQLARCTTGILASDAVAVLYSLGGNAPNGGGGADERHNPNDRGPLDPTYVAPDRVFVTHDPTPDGAAAGAFDDLVVWLSANVLYNRLVAAGRVP